MMAVPDVKDDCLFIFFASYTKPNPARSYKCQFREIPNADLTDGYISEKDFADMARFFADSYNAPLEKKERLVIAFVNLWRKFDKAGDLEKESRLTLPILIESVKQQLYDPELVTCLVQVMRGMFDIMDINQDGYLQPDEHKSLFASVGIPEGRFDAKAAFDAIDVNGDGILSFDEFIAGCLDFFFSQDESSPNKFFFGHLVD